MDFVYELNQIILRELGDAIVNRRKKLGLKQTELAELAGYSVRYQCMVENGQKNVTLCFLVAISVALDCNIRQLLDDVMRSIEGSLASNRRFKELWQQAVESVEQKKKARHMNINNKKESIYSSFSRHSLCAGVFFYL